MVFPGKSKGVCFYPINNLYPVENRLINYLLQQLQQDHLEAPTRHTLNLPGYWLHKGS